MSKFKPGDRVRRIGGDLFGIKHGNIYTVKCHENNGVWLKEIAGGYSAANFEKVEDEPMKKLDYKLIDALPVCEETKEAVPGVSKRELFAAMAMQGMLAQNYFSGGNGSEACSNDAVKYAEALLAKLKESEG